MRHFTYVKACVWIPSDVPDVPVPKQRVNKSTSQNVKFNPTNRGPVTHWKLLGVPMSALVSRFFLPLFFFSFLNVECMMLFI